MLWVKQTQQTLPHPQTPNAPITALDQFSKASGVLGEELTAFVENRLMWFDFLFCKWMGGEENAEGIFWYAEHEELNLFVCNYVLL